MILSLSKDIFMANPEIQKSWKERWGIGVRNGGIVAALIGLISNWAGVVVGGVVLIAGGEALRNNGKSLKRQA
jgi:hypothetical protein